MDATKNLLFALDCSKAFGEKVAQSVELNLSAHEERDFQDGEHKIRSLVNVQNKNIYIICSLFGDKGLSVNDKLCRLLFFIGSLKDAGASAVIPIVPYLCYSRKDRKTKSRDPVTTQYLARIFEAMGASSFVTLDVHNLQAFENSFRIPTVHLEAGEYFISYFAEEAKDKETVVLSPDAGGVKRAAAFARALEQETKMIVPVAVMHKTRSEGIVGGTEAIFGDVRAKMVIIIDDLISSGTTLVRAAKACKEAGADKVYAAATHGVFVDKANETLVDSALDKIIITNSIPPIRLDKKLVRQKMEIIDIAPLIGNMIKDSTVNSQADFVGIHLKRRPGNIPNHRSE
jgi:ribose-phosphate pyrophosphokinase